MCGFDNVQQDRPGCLTSVTDLGSKQVAAALGKVIERVHLRGPN